MGRRRVRLQDIAERAEVSLSTVSLVLNDKTTDGNVRISKQTIRHVRQIAAEMGYFPNLAARAMSRGKTMMVGLVVPWIGPVEAAMIDGITEVLKKERYSLAMGVPTQYDFQTEVEEIRAMDSKGFDCLIIMPSFEFVNQGEKLRDLFHNRERVVLVYQPPCPGFSYVTVNHERCGYLAAKHLLELGHRRIEFVGPHYPSESTAMSPESLTPSHPDFDPFIDAIVNARYQGYLRAIKEYGASPIVAKFGVEGFDIPEVTAVYCSRSLGAVDLLGVCYDRGVRVPDQLSIVAQGNDREKNVVRPRLTTIDVRAKEMGVHAARTVLDIIDGRRPENVILEPELIVQESTRAL